MPQLPGTSLLVLALMNPTFDGRGSLILTLSARVVPWFVILTVKVWGSPTCTVLGRTVFSTSRSTNHASRAPAAPPSATSRAPTATSAPATNAAARP